MKRLVTLPLVAICVTAAFAQSNEGYYMQPSIRGSTIVFVSQGDLWTVPVGGGLAHALTSHTAPVSNPALSPDGNWVAFSGTYEGPTDVYVMPISGGLPKRLTYTNRMNVQNWTGKGILAETSIYSTLPNAQLINIDPANGKETRVQLEEAADGDYDGNTLFFTRHFFQGSHTKRYEGGTAQHLWKYTEGAEEAVPLTADYKGTSKSPMIWNGRVYFLSDRDGTMNLWSMDENGRDLRELTHHMGWDIQSASMSDGKVAYQLGADIWVCDVKTGQDAKVPITLESDFDQTREDWVTDPMKYVTAAEPAKDGSAVAITARGEVFIAPAEPGRLVQATRKQGVRYRYAMFMPDGKSLLAVSDQTGETEWWKLPANGVGTPEQITSGTTDLITGGEISPDGKLLAYTNKNQELYLCDMASKQSSKLLYCPDGEFTDLRWSPDSQWLAFVMPTPTFNRIMVYSVKTGKSVPVTTDRADSSSPAWSPDGKWLYFLSDRTFHSLVSNPWGDRQPEPFFTNETKIYQIALVKGLRSPFQAPDELYKAPTPPPAKEKETTPAVDIDFDGIMGRLWEVPIGAGNYSALTVDKDRLFLLSSGIEGPGNLAAVDIKNRDAKIETLVDAVEGYDLSDDGTKLLIQRSNNFYLVPSAGKPDLSKPVDLSGWALDIVPREEWRQMFTEAWRLERDYFYDVHMNGVDWKGVLNQYLPLVDRVRDRNELSNLLGQMISELSALHMFVFGGDMWHSQDNIAPAFLGGVLTRDEADGGYRIDRIYSGDPDYPDSMAPLAKPDVAASVGDIVTMVNGEDVLAAPDLSSLLRNEAGKQVLITLKDPKSGQSRQVIVTPIDFAQQANLRYTDWEVSRRQIVDKESDDTIGYIHLRAMGQGDIAQWERDFYPVFNRAGLIIDVRHNNGGNIDSWILEKLMRKAWDYFQPRLGNKYWNMQEAFRGHIVVLCDAWTASDGETFCAGIERNHLGTVIGTRTWGGGIWLSEDNGLVDGGMATAAEYGAYGPEGQWLVEGHGIDPDIVVDDLPHQTFLGKDAQLQAAIDYLQKEIKEHPVAIPATPPYPNKALKTPKPAVHPS